MHALESHVESSKLCIMAQRSARFRVAPTRLTTTEYFREQSQDVRSISHGCSDASKVADVCDRRWEP